MTVKKKISTKQWLVVGGWFFPLLVAGLIGLFYTQLPKELPLYYSLPWGKEQLSSKTELFIIPSLLLVISTINNLMVLRWRKNGFEFLAMVVACFSLICSLFGLITVVQIISIVI